MKITIENKGSVILQLNETQVPEYCSVMNFDFDGEAQSIHVRWSIGEPNGACKDFWAMCGQWDKLEVMP